MVITEVRGAVAGTAVAGAAIPDGEVLGMVPTGAAGTADTILLMAAIILGMAGVAGMEDIGAILAGVGEDGASASESASAGEDIGLRIRTMFIHQHGRLPALPTILATRIIRIPITSR